MIQPASRSLELLPPLLKAAAERQLAPDEVVLSAAYLVEIAEAPNARAQSSAPRKQPGRAVIVLQSRVLVLDDPGDSVTASAPKQYVAACCSIDSIIAIELRSHLLDCAFTLVVAAPDGAQRVTISYNGVSEPAVLGLMSCIRMALDPRWRSAAVTSDLQGGTPNGNEPQLSHRQHYFLRKHVAPTEQVRGILAIPAQGRGHPLLRLAVRAHEQPAMLIARTDQQVLLIKDAPRTRREKAPYGCDAWLMPLRTLAAARLKQSAEEAAMLFALEHAGVCYQVEIAVPARFVSDAAAFVQAIHDVL